MAKFSKTLSFIHNDKSLKNMERKFLPKCLFNEKTFLLYGCSSVFQEIGRTIDYQSQCLAIYYSRTEACLIKIFG